MRKWFQVIALTAACSVYGQGSFQGPFLAISNYTPTASTVLGTAGWAFQPNYGFEISHLGVFNTVLSDAAPFATVHLWDSSSNVLATATVSQGSLATNGGVFNLIQPVPINAGTTYYIGAYASQLGIGVDVAVGNESFVVGPAIHYLGAGQNTNATAIGVIGLDPGAEAILYAGPNFLYYVPEPSSFAVLGLGAVALLFRRRT